MCSSSFQVFDKAVSQQLSAVLDKWKGKTLPWKLSSFIVFLAIPRYFFLSLFFDDLLYMIYIKYSKLVMSLDVCFLLVGIGNHVKKPLSAVVTSNVLNGQVEGGAV